MENQIQKNINNSLALDFDNDEGIWIKRGKTLRMLIGILGVSLPILLLLITFIFFGLNSPLESISHYYFTRASTIFTTILSLIAIFLIVYSGKEPIDFYISTLAGITAMIVVFFPTGNLVEVCCDPTKSYAVTNFPESSIRETIHLISAGIFIASLAFMSYFIFTKSNKPAVSRGKAKVIRNRIYRVCGFFIVIALAIIFLGFIEVIPENDYNNYNLTFWMETLAIESFGFSWLVKGGAFFKDRN